jgi:hypothetical protein
VHCPAEGSGDVQAKRPSSHAKLDLLKNRVDMAEWVATAVSEIVNWRWEPGDGKQPDQWPDEIVQKNGLPLAVEGYLLAVRPENKAPGESCNCHATDLADVDFHMWLYDREPPARLGPNPKERGQSLVLEVTPRVRANHPSWTPEHLKRIISARVPVRVSGWSFFDPQHGPEVRGSQSHAPTRATLWEVHPILEIEVQRGGQWIKLDDDRP